jgi:hypothetical protein
LSLSVKRDRKKKSQVNTYAIDDDGNQLQDRRPIYQSDLYNLFLPVFETIEYGEQPWLGIGKGKGLCAIGDMKVIRMRMVWTAREVREGADECGRFETECVPMLRPRTETNGQAGRREDK